ncbi:hypothetical protein RND81_10G122400 [Saponaria officinalis]|uniref:Uncharacterized protein n=1 Tax=Saponaria officinalis TaxID=3572 RepID=A0AAW1I417_SAPOF
MAVDLLADTSSSRGISPRISFSHDLKNCEIVPIEQNSPLKSSLLDYDFDFCVSKRSCDQNSSLADELFANGVILPIQIKRKDIKFVSKNNSSSNDSRETEEKQGKFINNNNNNIKNNNSNNIRINNNDNNINNDENKSFWKFKRSKSMNCGRIYRRGLCSLPLLSRSKSTGSSTSAKRSLICKDEISHNNNNINNINNNGKMGNLKNNNSSNYQKPPLKKNYGGGSSYNHGVSPIINVVPSGSLFGFGSLFSNGKDKCKKK